MWILLNFLQKLPLKETPVIDGVILENFFYRKKREFYDFCTWMFVLYSNFKAENKALRKKNLKKKSDITNVDHKIVRSFPYYTKQMLQM